MIKKKINKYHNNKTEVDGIIFASKREAKRYCELKLLEKAKQIKDLTLQHKFKFDGLCFDNGRTVTYIADFVYTDCNTGKQVVEDVKGMKTDVYGLKKALMRYFFKIDILETK